MTEDDLTTNEQKVIDKFESLREGCGKYAKQRIISSYSGWREIIANYDQKYIDQITAIGEGENDGHTQT